MRSNLVSFLGVNFSSIGFNNFVELLSKTGGIVFTPNVDHLAKLSSDIRFRNNYLKANFLVCDSQIILLLSRLMGKNIEAKISGSDLFPAFYLFNKSDLKTTIFLLGGKPGVAEKARENINKKCGRSIVVDTYSPSFDFEYNDVEREEILSRIKNSGATVVAVGLGAPKQENWIAENQHLLPDVKIFLAIGATIDFEADVLKRSPSIISKLGLEWLYRISKEPRRLWLRYVTSGFILIKLILLETQVKNIAANKKH